jgi:hypothetical protein
MPVKRIMAPAPQLTMSESTTLSLRRSFCNEMLAGVASPEGARELAAFGGVATEDERFCAWSINASSCANRRAGGGVCKGKGKHSKFSTRMYKQH